MGNKATQSFTLIELLVVIVTIGILALIAYPAYTSVQERAKATADMNNLRQIGVATQMYMNDNDGVLFSTTGSWMSQLKPKYLPAWKIFQSPFDTRAASEVGDATTPISYGLNGNPSGSSIAGLSVTRITNASGFIIFAPAQASRTTVSFQGTALTPLPYVTVFKTATNPGGPASGGTHGSRQKINALFADLHAESISWSNFSTDACTSTNPSASPCWTPYFPYP
jgi:prepilin-type N-terminal cleavage/methylation domain-containing protein/prepilin-type processing-associated H-X9-DG protein